jgi:hypothetical protein
MVGLRLAAALGAHVGVELVRSTARTAHITGFRLHYKNGGQDDALTLREDVRLCGHPTSEC